ncbi:hypothetical protein P7C71_g6590, partial [Lecanoromycetidae sp. Uapishka_2]
PSSPAYTKKLARWSTTATKPAAAILLATCTADISTTILFCTHYAIDIAIRGGGHSTSGSSSTNGGIVIDLSEMRNVVVSPEEMTVTAQGGCLWVDVDSAAAAHGLATVGGTVNHTGVGGLTLGGGYGWLCGRYGLTIDNLVSARVVLADGRLVRASETENRDLFWGLRGAGQSLGVVVEFTYRLHEQRNLVWAGQMLFTPDHLDKVCAFTNHLSATSKGEDAAFVGFAAPPPLLAPLLSVVVFYNGDEVKANEVFKPLLEIDAVVREVGMMAYHEVNSILNPVSKPGGRKVNKGVAYATPVRPAFFREVFDEFARFAGVMPDARDTTIGLWIFATDKMCEVNNSEMAFANRGRCGMSLVMVQWNDEANDELCRRYARCVANMFRAEMVRAMVDNRIESVAEGVGEYLNSDGFEPSKQSGRKVFGQNYERLAKLKEKYDPDNIFNKGHLGASLAKTQDCESQD